VNDITLFVAVLSPMSNYCSITSVSLYNPTKVLKKKCGPYSCRKYWCLYVAYIDVLFAGF